MKIMIAYPPLESSKGTPLLGQNRQFQWFNSPTFIYPMVPAQAATLLKENGYEVVWSDGIAEEWTYEQFLKHVEQEKPDLIAIETKTPVVKQHWCIINDLKNLSTINFVEQRAESVEQREEREQRAESLEPRERNTKGFFSKLVAQSSPLIALFGDHVTALPEESMRNSKVDFVLTGGDYDFLLLNLCNYLSATSQEQRAKRRKDGLEWGAVGRENGAERGKDSLEQGAGGREKKTELSAPSSTLSADLEPGIWYRQNGEIENTGPFELNHDLNSLPFIDRDLTKWQLYAYKNGNYKRLPGTYTMAARDCWWGKCTFCSWTTIYPRYRKMGPERVLDEIGDLIQRYDVREIMDDSGTFPVGKWLRDFCEGMIKREYNKKVVLDCNMRFGALSLDEYKLMKRAGFRLLLFGLESGNQQTLDRVNKGLTLEEIEESSKLASKAGFDPHITVMFGYPWETEEEVKKTVDFARYLMRRGYASTLQATIVIPYPGTPLFEECKKNGLLKTLDWTRYDMREPVMKTPVGDEKLKEAVQSLYKVAFHPEFVARKILNVRSLEDVKFLGRAALKVGGHLLDFKNNQSKSC